MVYIPFPRLDLDKDVDLEAWRNITSKKEGDWKKLRNFLTKQPRLKPKSHAIPKCWYTELPQGDSVASDVEHFRPKNSGDPLNEKQVDELKKLAGVDFYQNPDQKPQN